MSSCKENRVNPGAEANILSRFFFWWPLVLMFKGYKKDITEADLYDPLCDHESKRLGDKLENLWDKEKQLWRALNKSFYAEFWKYAPVCLVLEAFKTCHPVFVGLLIEYFTPNSNLVSTRDACIYGALLVLTSIGRVLSLHYLFFGLLHLGMKIKLACSSLIYRKILGMNRAALTKTSVGQITNLLSNDVSRFETSFMNVHIIWSGPIFILLQLYYLYVLLGATALVSIGVLFFFLLIQSVLASMTSFYRLQVAKATDKRVKLIAEIISGIQVIKMYAWELPYVKLVQISRKFELEKLKVATFANIIVLCFTIFVNRVALLCTITTYMLSGNSLNARYIFILYSYIDGARQGLITYMPRAILAFAETLTTLKRVENFLLNEKSTRSENEKCSTPHQKENLGVFARAVSVQWSPQNYALRNINLTLRPNEIIGIVGPVGAGKSTLLYTILRELPLSEGQLQVDGIVSFASQEPWIFSGSVRENILFGSDLDERKYRKVTEVCALEHDLSLFPHGDLTLVGERGVMLSGGQKIRISLARAIYKDADIYLLDDPLSALDQRVGKEIFNKCFMGYLKNKCRILVTHQIQHLKHVNEIYLLKAGTVSFSGNFAAIQDHQDDFVAMLKAGHVSDNIAPADERRNYSINHRSSDENVEQQSRNVKEELSLGTISHMYYKEYLASAGHCFFAAIVISLFLLTQIVGSLSDVFLASWVRSEETRNREKDKLVYFILNQTDLRDKIEIASDSNEYLYIYTGLVTLLIVTTLIRSRVLVCFCIKASGKLHEKMFSKVIVATMKFFNTNASGRILNRFSKDMNLVDESLPPALSDAAQLFLACLGAVLVTCYVDYWNVIPSVALFAVAFLFRTLYSPTNSNLKRIEAIRRSPIYSHVTSSLQGLTTIRAFNAQSQMKNQFDEYQNSNSAAFYIYMACHSCFCFWMDMFCCIFVMIVVISTFCFKETMDGSKVGLALTQALSLAVNLQICMKTWCEVDNQLTSVERIIEYTKLSEEIDDGKSPPPESWPKAGNIKCQSVSMKYSLDEPYVLKEITFNLGAGEKIGIVGRTGAGKSSLISAFFRLNPNEGNIFIDDVNIEEIPLRDLRSKISVIPQDPVLFSGTLRKNLDPFDEYEDSVLWGALEEVRMKETVLDLSTHLLTDISEGGSNFSVGERQLLCLARAVIRDNKILILDEVTANVDPVTDELIQSTIREKFKEATVITIAHRLQTVMDSDRVIVIEQGRLVQFDVPFLLLQDKQGIFYELVHQAEPEVVDMLCKIAEEVARS